MSGGTCSMAVRIAASTSSPIVPFAGYPGEHGVARWRAPARTRAGPPRITATRGGLWCVRVGG